MNISVLEKGLPYSRLCQEFASARCWRDSQIKKTGKVDYRLTVSRSIGIICGLQRALSIPLDNWVVFITGLKNGTSQVIQ
jgi:hypothetical protein